eukprot:TRINITY_DN96120_c0_g1_i1.p1 TRINITY_DN96120_c0_g1~~TRINITY_DN96120_c0_g1_i1.p1  ORF type:complete len:111 (-),score=8.26 TRINITY_DN96120_c0_g1_i1:31-363(-)
MLNLGRDLTGLLANNRMERVERLCLPTQRHGSRATASDQARVSSVLNYCHLLSTKEQQNRQIVSIRNPKPFLKALPLWNVDSIIDLDMQASPRLHSSQLACESFHHKWHC